MPTTLPCHQAEWHQQHRPSGREWQQHTALTGMSTETQLRPLTAHSFWLGVLRSIKALTDQTLNISAICPIIFAFQSEAYEFFIRASEPHKLISLSRGQTLTTEVVSTHVTCGCTTLRQVKTMFTCVSVFERHSRRKNSMLMIKYILK